jgi:hypothetical protein
METSDVVLSGDLVKSVRAELGTAEESGLADKTLRDWVTEDEDSFENAVLISELVSKNLGSVRAPAGAPAPETRPSSAPAAPKNQPRPRPQTVPGIADMLDDMLSQRRDRR